MDYETLNVLTQSRKTLLKLLADRGYTVEAYQTFGPTEISLMAAAGPEAFRMDLERPEEAAGASKITKCRVIYTLNRIKNRISAFLNDVKG